MTGTPSRTARVPIVRWDLKEAEGNILTRGTRIACEASCRGARQRRCPKPSVIRNGPVYMRRVWKEGHASYPGRSACLPRARAAERESDGLRRSQQRAEGLSQRPEARTSEPGPMPWSRVPTEAQSWELRRPNDPGRRRPEVAMSRDSCVKRHRRARTRSDHRPRRCVLTQLWDLQRST